MPDRIALPPAVLDGLATVLNQALALDPQVPAALAELDGRVAAIEIAGLDLRLLLLPRADGRLDLAQGDEPAPECTLAGSPLDLLRSGDPNQGRRQLFAGNVEIRGDADLGRRIGEILGGLDIDWEELLSRMVGDVAAHQVARAARAAGRYADETGDNVRDNLVEYLTEEARLLPTRYQCDRLRDDIERLRDDVERAGKRVERLEKRRTGPGADADDTR